jgi:hypothetical protein
LDDVSTGLKSGNEDLIILTVNEFGYFTFNGKETLVKAKAKVEIINANEYIIPAITIVSVDEIRRFKIDNITTTIAANDANQISLSVNQDGFWEINGFNTEYRALKISESIIDDTVHVKRTVDINISGNWIINGVTTNIKAPNHLLILEIAITLLLSVLAYTIMWGFSNILKKIRMVPE